MKRFMHSLTTLKKRQWQGRLPFITLFIVVLLSVITVLFFYFRTRVTTLFLHRAPITISVAKASEARQIEHVLIRSMRQAYQFMSKKSFDELLSLKFLRRMFKQFQDSPHNEKTDVLVAKAHGTIVGYVLMHKLNASSLFMENLFVLPEYQRQGIGQRLVNAAIKAYKQKDAHLTNCYVYTRKKNKRSQTFYYKMDFSKIHEFPEKDYVLYVLLKKI